MKESCPAYCILGEEEENNTDNNNKLALGPEHAAFIFKTMIFLSPSA